MTPDETRIAEIEARVRPTICETWSAPGRCSIEGRITKEDFETLLASRLAWRFTSKCFAQEGNNPVGLNKATLDVINNLRHRADQQPISYKILFDEALGVAIAVLHRAMAAEAKLHHAEQQP